jgi:hypothetical protein
MVNLNASKRANNRGNGGSTFQPMENILVQVKTVHEHDPKSPTPDKDYIEAYLMHDAGGITAEFDNDGNPLTLITARIDTNAKGRYANPDPTKTPLEMWDLKPGRKKGTSDRMGQDGLVILEKAKKVGDREFQAAFLFTAQRNRASEKDMVIENVMTTVYPEKTRKLPDGTERRGQERRIYITNEATKVSTMAELRAAIAEKLEDDRAERPFAVIHVIGTKPEDRTFVDDEGNTRPRYPYEALSATVYPAWENEERLSSEQAIDRWFTEPAKSKDGALIYQKDENGDTITDANGEPLPELRNGEMVDIVTNYLGSEELMFEVIGGFTYGTGKNSLPSAKGRKSDHWNFEMDWENRVTGETKADRDTGKNYVMQGVAAAHMVLGRVEDENEPGVYGPWYAQKTYTVRSYNPPVFLERELITPHTPKEVAELFVEQAERRSKAKNEQFRNNRTSEAGPVEENDDIPVDNEPAYDGGMAMSR